MCVVGADLLLYGLAKVVFHYIVSMVMLSRFQIPLGILGVPTSRATSDWLLARAVGSTTCTTMVTSVTIVLL